MSVMVDSAFAGSHPVRGDLGVAWIHGSPSPRHRTDPPLQVHAYDEHTYVLRQSKDVTFEAPFVVLLLGSERAMLLDSGAVDDRTLRDTVDHLIEAWLAAHPRETYPLVVAHTHAHRDHRAGDGQFADRPDTVVVGTDVASVREFFGFTDWPTDVVTFELGDRTLEITGAPGHHESSVAIYDPWSGLLLTGDTVYPGRLYVRDTPAFVDSLRRLVAFAEAREVTHVRAVRDAAVRVAGTRGIHRFDSFIVWNRPGPAVQARQAVRSLVDRIRRRLPR